MYLYSQQPKKINDVIIYYYYIHIKKSLIIIQTAAIDGISLESGDGWVTSAPTSIQG